MKITFRAIFGVTLLGWTSTFSTYNFMTGSIFGGFMFLIFTFFILDFIYMNHMIVKGKKFLFFPLSLISALVAFSSTFKFMEEMRTPEMMTISFAIIICAELFYVLNFKTIFNFLKVKV